jgi:hypothetical protein
VSLAALDVEGVVPPEVTWWSERLLQRLATQAQRADWLDEYFRGDQTMPPMCHAVRDSYRRLMYLAVTNYAELIVEAVCDRMHVHGFRTGADADPSGDAEAWNLWQANALDADSSIVHRTMLSLADSYVMVGRDIDGQVLITPEDPRQVITESDPLHRRRTIAALKLYRDDVDGLDRLLVYLPGVVWVATRPTPEANYVAGPDTQPVQWLSSHGDWTWQPTPIIPPVDRVPIVRFANRPDTFGASIGEFERHVPLLDRITYGTLNRLEIATLQAFRQRAVKGVPQNDEYGNPIDYDDIFAASPGALWTLPETADLWESGQVDLSPILKASESDVQQLFGVSRTPMQYFFPPEANQSAEGAETSKEALVNKTIERLAQTGESWEEVMSLAFAFAGDVERASRADMEVIWGDPQQYTLSEKADAASKAQAGGLSWRATMERVWQLSPQEIDRMESERMADQLAAGLAAPLPAPGARP